MSLNRNYENILEKVNDLQDEDIWKLFAVFKKELKKRHLIRTNNIVGERGEFVAVDKYNSMSGLPKLQKAPEGTQNVDALSRDGERYSIKTITEPGKTTGVFYAIDKDDLTPEKKFEFVIIVVLDSDLNPKNIYQIDWKTFLRHMRWHSRMRAFNLTITKSLVEDSVVIV